MVDRDSDVRRVIAEVHDTAVAPMKLRLPVDKNTKGVAQGTAMLPDTAVVKMVHLLPGERTMKAVHNGGVAIRHTAAAQTV